MNDSSAHNAYHIRDARPVDVTALAHLHVNTFNETHGPIPNGPMPELRAHQWAHFFETNDPEQFCLVIEDQQGQLTGFAKGVPYLHNDLPFTGELNKIYLLKKYHRQGLGRLLLCSVARRFLQQGISSMLLFGDARNPGNGFYEAMGAEKLFAANGEFHGGYGWRDLHALVAQCHPNP